ncbi:hypothetical protein AV530_011178 [Patagioenas fasciata monilis]|uniref:Uncharacterized protein n=1 Tax=Patagioenas fasciata monilis TaxID=372326 RepID=A0A1V4JQ56_PATFA|nr:hypothetical protein AV530_011178 [Patagioenas fasciata monilis]
MGMWIFCSCSARQQKGEMTATSSSLGCSHQEGPYRDPQAKTDQTVVDSHQCGAKGEVNELRHNAAVNTAFYFLDSTCCLPKCLGEKDDGEQLFFQTLPMGLLLAMNRKP